MSASIELETISRMAEMMGTQAAGLVHANAKDVAAALLKERARSEDCFLVGELTVKIEYKLVLDRKLVVGSKMTWETKEKHVSMSDPETYDPDQPGLPGMNDGLPEIDASETMGEAEEAAEDEKVEEINIPLPKKLKATVGVRLLQIHDEWANGWLYQAKSGGVSHPAHKHNPYRYPSKAVAFSQAQAELLEYVEKHCPAAVPYIEQFTPEF